MALFRGRRLPGPDVVASSSGAPPGGHGPELDLLEALIVHLPAAVSVLDRDLRFLAVNERAAAINGVLPGAHVGRPLTEVLPQLPADFVGQLRGVVAQGRPLIGVAVEGSTAAAPGRLRRWIGNYYPIHDRSGDVVGVAAVFEETNESPAEAGPVELLVRGRAGMLSVLDTVVMNAPVGVAVLDADLRYVYINPAAAEANGLPVDAHLGRRVEEMVPALATAVAPVLRSVVATGVEIRDLEMSGVLPSGSADRRHWLLSVFPVHGPDGTPAGVAVIAPEITEQKHRSDRMRLLQEFTAALSDAGTVQQVSEAVWEKGRPTVGAVAAGIAVVDPSGAELRFVPTRGQRQFPGDRWSPVPVHDDSPLAEVARTGRPLFFDSPQALLESYPALRSIRDRTGDQSLAILPLATPGSPAGALAFAFARPAVFDEEERNLLETVAGLSEQALTRARLYEQEHRAADDLQRSLLPARLPTIPTAELAVRYVAADSAQVGGDFYDAVRLDRAGEPTWRLVIGDVSGRGVGAAGTAGLARHTLRALNSDYSPAGALRRLDALLRDGQDPGRFLTAVCADLVLRPDHAVLTACVAGHPPPLVLRHDGRVDAVELRGGLLGLLDEVRLDELEIHLRPGDSVLLYTDGVTETHGRDGLFGDDRLAAVVRDCIGCDAEQIAGRVESAIAAHRRDSPSDDVAILVLRMTGPPVS